MNVVITGASRGIGLALSRLVLEAGHELLAVARSPSASPGLSELAARFGARLRLLAGDVQESGIAASIAVAAAARWEAVDLLVNNAGILRQGTQREDFMSSFAVNSVAPFEVTQALLPLLRKSANPRVAHLTSWMGSITDNSSGGYYAYRASKAALNMINKSLARDHAWLATAVVHPGWVRTDMGGAEAPLDPQSSASGIWQQIERLQHRDSGRFFDYLGNELPW
jgi:NAD(P)-dependent dehydrogenase (short-subunit alcohol dehydrogenase family)